MSETSETVWRDAAQDMANDNRRLCNIVEKADALAEAVRKFGDRHFAIKAALDAYTIVRQGQ